MKDEQVTFDGIPIPLTLATLLDAMIATAYSQSEMAINLMDEAPYLKRVDRQYTAFRERILRVDAEKDMHIELLKSSVSLAHAKDARIAELEERREIIDVDKSHLWNINKNLKQRIAELEDMLDTANHDTGRVQ